MNVLVIIQTVATDMRACSGMTSLVHRPWGLCGVGDNLEIMLGSYRHDFIHVGRLSKNVYDHDGTCVRRNVFFY